MVLAVLRFFVLPLLLSFACACSLADENPSNEVDPFTAAYFGKFESLKLLLNENSDLIKATDEYGATLLHRAARGNQPDLIRYLVEQGASIEANGTKRKQTPLHCAADTGKSFEAAKVLIELGADVNARPEFRLQEPIDGADSKPIPDWYGESVLELAANSGDYRLVDLLINKGTKVQEESFTFGNPLHHACSGFERNNLKDSENVGNHKVIALLTKHLDINTRGRLKRTPLHYAAGYGAVEKVKYLVSNYDNIKLDASDSDGNTPLHMAVEGIIGAAPENRAKIIKILIKAGADINRTNRNRDNTERLTPQQYAEKLGNKTIIDAFKTE